TATFPGAARASPLATSTRWACACGERTTAMCSIPGSRTSSINRPAPTSRARSSRLRRGIPVYGMGRRFAPSPVEASAIHEQEGRREEEDALAAAHAARTADRGARRGGGFGGRRRGGARGNRAAVRDPGGPGRVHRLGQDRGAAAVLEGVPAA